LTTADSALVGAWTCLACTGLQLRNVVLDLITGSASDDTYVPLILTTTNGGSRKRICIDTDSKVHCIGAHLLHCINVKNAVYTFVNSKTTHLKQQISELGF